MFGSAIFTSQFTTPFIIDNSAKALQIIIGCNSTSLGTLTVCNPSLNISGGQGYDNITYLKGVIYVATDAIGNLAFTHNKSYPFFGVNDIEYNEEEMKIYIYGNKMLPQTYRLNYPIPSVNLLSTDKTKGIILNVSGYDAINGRYTIQYYNFLTNSYIKPVTGVSFSISAII